MHTRVYALHEHDVNVNIEKYDVGSSFFTRFCCLLFWLWLLYARTIFYVLFHMVFFLSFEIYRVDELVLVQTVTAVNELNGCGISIFTI